MERVTIDLVDSKTRKNLLRYESAVIPSIGHTISIPQTGAEYLVEGVDHVIRLRDAHGMDNLMELVTVLVSPIERSPS